MSIWQTSGLLKEFVGTIPQVESELGLWAAAAEQLPTPLREQALSSIKHKAFHCVGGSVYSLYPGADRQVVLPLIVALQTISDYLDNLCDRMRVTDPDVFRVLHFSFLDALDPHSPLRDYYALYPYSEDVYLPKLVTACQEALKRIPHYSKLQHHTLRLGKYYCELQIRKHAANREELLREWIENTFPPELAWNEWAAASGSTLGIFLIFASGFSNQVNAVEQAMSSYFPWIQGLHILLDYLIDREEDLYHGDLNFTFYYPTKAVMTNSLLKFVHECRSRAKDLPNSFFHRTVIDGLIALYGSDLKVRRQGMSNIVSTLAGQSGPKAMLKTCGLMRKVGLLP